GRAAAWIIGQIGQLYAVEKHLREHRRGGSGPQLRAAVREWQSRPILARLRRALELLRRRVLPKSHLGQAIDYTLARWAALTRYVDDGRLEIDNNQCENAIRPTAVGKKNFLFVGHPEAGQRSAVIYSILGSCRRHGVNPADYLRAIFERLPKAKISEVKTLTPSAWSKARRARPPSAA
ncbi:MAG: transposase, partial [Verrucomicrobiota bacterium]